MHHRDDDVCCLGRRTRLIYGADRASDSEHAGVCVGREDGVGADRGIRGVVHRWSRSWAWICEPTRFDGGTVYSESIQCEGWRADVSYWRSSEVAWGWESGVFGAVGRAGE